MVKGEKRVASKGDSCRVQYSTCAPLHLNYVTVTCILFVSCF